MLYERKNGDKKSKWLLAGCHEKITLNDHPKNRLADKSKKCWVIWWWAEQSEARNKLSSENIQWSPQTAQTLPVILPPGGGGGGGGGGFIHQTEDFLSC